MKNWEKLKKKLKTKFFLIERIRVSGEKYSVQITEQFT